jgi:hypothetical protein
MPTSLYGVVFGEINSLIFSRRQFSIEGAVKAFIWINTKCPIVKIDHPKRAVGKLLFVKAYVGTARRSHSFAQLTKPKLHRNNKLPDQT